MIHPIKALKNFFDDAAVQEQALYSAFIVGLPAYVTALATGKPLYALTAAAVGATTQLALNAGDIKDSLTHSFKLKARRQRSAVKRAALQQNPAPKAPA
jgi:hypothetical protein